MSRKSLPVLLLILCAYVAAAQPKIPSKDPRVEQVVRAVSPDHIRANIEKLVSFGTRQTLSNTTDPNRGIGAARRWIKSEFERYATASKGRMTVAFDEFVQPVSPRIPRPTTIVDVVATLRPADTTQPSSRRRILIGGHYDSRVSDILDTVNNAPGADDDGSGAALVLELARVLSTADVRTTIMFVCFAGEEQGLYGSEHLAEEAQQEGWTIDAVLNNDIVGAIRGGDGQVDSTTVRVFSQALSPLDTGSVLKRINALGLENDGPSRSLARYSKEIGERYVPHFSVRMIYRGDRFLRGGDHMSFHQRGFAAVRFSESKEDFNHQHQDIRMENGIQYGDLLKFVNPRYCANIVRVNAAIAASLAFAPQPPAAPSLVIHGLAYGTTLRWDRDHEGGLAGYLVRWRETSSPTWQHERFTADTTLTLTESKDDFFFSVQAVSSQGDPSLYAIPIPAR